MTPVGSRAAIQRNNCAPGLQGSSRGNAQKDCQPVASLGRCLVSIRCGTPIVAALLAAAKAAAAYCVSCPDGSHYVSATNRRGIAWRRLNVIGA